MSTRDHITPIALGAGIAVPFLYYGSQLIAAPFYPGYSFVRQVASMLGSPESTRPWIFNTGAMATGLAAIVASVGFFRAFRDLGVNRVLTWLVVVSLVVSGASSVRAGWFPLPDPRHGGHPALLVAMLALPLLLTVTLWRKGNSWPLKMYLVTTLVVLGSLVPLLSGMTGIDTGAYRGLLQRILSLSLFPPIAVCSFVLLRRTRPDFEGK